jgi:hypothetical protein
VVDMITDRLEQFAYDDSCIYITAGDNARGKLFKLSLPDHAQAATQTNEPATGPVALTSQGTASALNPLADGRLVFMRSSFTSPNDVFVLESADGIILGSGLERRLTDLYKTELADKTLHPGTELWSRRLMYHREVFRWLGEFIGEPAKMTEQPDAGSCWH